ncbi:MAG: NADH-quinone oxidoreductase subunit NuoE [Bacteroidetes bacterium HGW-Bacteroidetes-11]|jgi:NADH-quinone oxidoreductase subunit E|nr:MAG: NADH-quinone oxidoreductase subunit NuoE [Bacteroidetes bacterium HGW-Bacteroidetes-11]
MADKIDIIIKKHLNVQRDTLLPLLQDIQTELGYLSEEAINRISVSLNLPTSKIYGVATFYDQFRFEPRGRFHLQICHGTACHINNGGRIIQEAERLLKIKEGQTTRDGMFSIEIVNCMGACGLSPVIAINDKYYHGIEPGDLKEIFEKCKDNSTSV